jgi:hypothetical protein
VLRVMRENRLLSPHRRPPHPANDHDGTILTDAPNCIAADTLDTREWLGPATRGGVPRPWGGCHRAWGRQARAARAEAFGLA